MPQKKPPKTKKFKTKGGRRKKKGTENRWDEQKTNSKMRYQNPTISKQGDTGIRIHWRVQK